MTELVTGRKPRGFSQRGKTRGAQMPRTQSRFIAVAVAGVLACLTSNAVAYTVYVSNEKGN